MSHNYDPGRDVAEGRLYGSRMPGRKDGELRVEVAYGEHARWPLRVDSKAGEWIVVASASTYYAGRSKDALEKHMRAIALAQRRVEWRRYIVIHYQADSAARYQHTHGRSAGPGEKRPDTVRSVSLWWEIEDYSEPFAVEGSAHKRRKVRDVSESFGEMREVAEGVTSNSRGYLTIEESAARELDPDGMPHDTHNEQWHTSAELPKNAIPFSRDALATLERLLELLGKVDAAIAGLLAGTPEQILERLIAPTHLALESGERCPDAGHHGEYDPPCPICDRL